MSTAAVIFAAACSWNAPGADPFMGNVPAAVHRYSDIPVAVRTALQLRMDRRQYDDVAVITRDSIRGRHEYSDLRQMHFGNVKVCGYVDRSGWADHHAERGLVYCEQEHCVIVPTVCRNVSRVTRLRSTAAPPPVPRDLPPLVPAYAPVQLASVPEVPAGPSEPVTVPMQYGGRMQALTFAAMSTPVVAPVWVSVPLPVVSEPATLLLSGLGLAGVLWMVKRRKRQCTQI